MEECIVKYLSDVPDEYMPRIGVVGIAGAVTYNTVLTVNIPHWPVSDGCAIAEICGFDSFVFINDFIAAGYGISTLQKHDVTHIGASGEAFLNEGANSVKIVIGPGTGLGQGVLIKGNNVEDLYEPFPDEGGHTNFAIKSEDDWELFKFA